MADNRRHDREVRAFWKFSGISLRQQEQAKGEKLDAKGVIISLFFGLTIGFGTGFVGTGGVKSLEGTGAMLAVSFAAGLLLLYFHYGMASGRTAAAVFAAAVCGAATETYSPGEWDTVTVPAAALAVLLLFL